MTGQRARRQRRDEEKKAPVGLRPMHISLRSGERLFLNGAVLRVDRKVTLELLNDATFLLENHVMQVQDTTTPLRQLYFAAQAMLMDPQNAKASRALFDAMATDILAALASQSLRTGLEDVVGLIAADRPFQALKALRGMFDEEQSVLASQNRRVLPEQRDLCPPQEAPSGGADEEVAVPPSSLSKATGALPQRPPTALQ
ncbi:MAG: flagellar biosynthesis repressor FlbT [Pseudomonadota bacterium]